MADSKRKAPKLRFPGFNDDWEQRKLSELTTYKNGKGHEDKQSETGKYELINLNSISIDGGLKHSGKYVNEGIDTLLTDDLVMILSDVGHGNLLGRVALIPEDNRFILNQRVALLRPNTNANPLFLFSYINAHQSYFKSQGAGMSQLNISKSSVENFSDFVPEKEEQEKIGLFFKRLDNLITLHQRKLSDVQKLKSGLLQKMFPKNGEKVPEIRFPEFSNDWEQRKLGEIVKKDTVKNNDLEFHSQDIISVAQMKDATTVRDSSDEYMMTYNKIRFGNIAFEGHANKEFPNGRFVLNDFRDGIVSHIYDVYIFTSRVDSAFMKKYINNPVVMRKILINSTSNARMMNSLNSKEFLKQKLLLPSFDEQQKIGVIFEQLDNLITLHQRKLEHLQQQKKALLQQMFI